MAAKAATWDKLAAALGVSPRRLRELREMANAPKSRDPKSWRRFMAERAAAAAAATAAREKPKSAAEIEREQLDNRWALARAEREERANAVEAGRLVTKEQAVEVASMVRDAFIAEGDSLPAAVLALLPAMGKSDKLAVEDAVRAAWRQARERIARGSAKGTRHG